MAARGVSLVLLLALIGLSQSLSASSVLSLQDQTKLRKIFQDASPFTDLETADYAVKGLKFFKSEIPTTQDLCKFVKEKVDINDIKSIYHASSVSKTLGNCNLALNDAEKKLNEAIVEGAKASTIFYAVSSLKNLGMKVDSNAVIKAIRAAASSEEDSVMSSVHSLNTAILLPKETDVGFIVDMVEDVVAQADEIDNTYLQFEGGLVPTAEVIAASYKLGEHLKKKPSIQEEQVIKFANYLLTRKHVQSVKDTFFLLRALNILSNNDFHVPVVVQLYGTPLISADNKIFKVRVTNVMDKALGKMSVTAVSATDSEGTTVLSNKEFKAGADDYDLDFMASKPSPGVYTVTVNVKPQKEDKRLIGTSGAQLKVKVVTKVTMGKVDLSLVDKEHSHTVKSLSTNYPNKFDKTIEADFHQKIVMKFAIKSEAGQLLTPHQAFVRLTNQKTKQEIFFVPEPDSSKMYKFDLDLGATAKDSFAYRSGKYDMDIVIGDAVIQNPFEWSACLLSLTFGEQPPKAKKEKQTMYSTKPQIDHQFRVPEKRPPQTVSTAFTVLVFVPLLIMFVVWFKIGANISNFGFSLSTIVFHIGLGAIFALYYYFWIKLDMFTTLKVLAVIGGITFLAANSLLSGIAARRAKR
ncbi:dolichyl-diphosphooligosaccharide--protein glycosyltransferase subunit 2-like isoform X2 [Actinia tenebrosa]|uniref:Dolichyl-diphosphooligosaccharide--protein glycosyltransferase subunit 2 n=1 Tax=Actinia tenebrosa TaxID=6105 RepID=A0A6P8HCZ4_ACTTE|nr:dolichyl-diphosphooligosaccharide--protein glycosyltransferase subunit 2-like isoform X2 [Actinia tenebrosa]